MLTFFRIVMAGLVPPAGPKPVRRGEGLAIHVFAAKAWMPDVPFFEWLGGRA